MPVFAAPENPYARLARARAPQGALPPSMRVGSSMPAILERALAAAGENSLAGIAARRAPASPSLYDTAITSPRAGARANLGPPVKQGTPSARPRGRERLPDFAAPVAPDPLGELYTSLIEQLQGPVGVDESDLMAQIRRQFDPVFDARRAALEEMMATAERRTGRGRGEVESQYEALRRDYLERAPEARQQAQEAQAEVEELYGQLRSNIEGNYSRIQQEQADLFEQLGIEAAAPEVLEPQGEEAAGAMTRADELGTLAEQRMADIGEIDESYYRSGAPLARLTGSNISTDMLRNLEDYLRGRETDITQLEAERTAGIQGAFTQLLQQAQSRAQQQEQFQQQMLFDILRGQMEARQQEPPDLTDPLTFVQTLPGPQRQNLMDAYARIQQDPTVIENRQPFSQSLIGGETVPTTPQYLISLADKMLEESTISQPTYQNLVYLLSLTGSEPFAVPPVAGASF